MSGNKRTAIWGGIIVAFACLPVASYYKSIFRGKLPQRIPAVGGNMKVFCLMVAVLCAGTGQGWAASPRTAAAVESAGGAAQTRSIEDFDINAVVEATIKAMAAAARNYYLPDNPANSKAISRYSKDAREQQQAF